MQMAMGELPDRSELPSLDIQVTDTLKRDNFIRLTISFTAAPGEIVPAYLYVPIQKVKHGKLPAMLILQGTTPLGKKSVDGSVVMSDNAIVADELVKRGYIVIVPDFPSFGDMKDYDFDNDRYQSGTMKGIFNHMRCVDLLQERDDVDPERIGVMGHSLGGHNSMFVGAFDTRLKVIISSCGWTQMDYYNTLLLLLCNPFLRLCHPFFNTYIFILPFLNRHFLKNVTIRV